MGGPQIHQVATIPLAARVDGSLYYVHQDHLGSTVAVSDAAGQAVGRVQYDPYGEVLTSTLPVTLTERLFTGQRFDSSSGLYYYNARYYDPHLGRFIQPDTLVPDPLSPQAWNRFSYCGNNPTSYVDPSGHGFWIPLLIFGGAFLLGAGMGGYYAYQQGYGFESWQLYAYAGMGGVAGVAGALTGMWIEAALLPVGATIWQAAAMGAAGGFAAGVVEQSILEVGGAAILGTEVSGERILLAGVTGGVSGGLFAGIGRAIRPLRPSGLGDLSVGEAKRIQAVVDEAGLEIHVVGSAAEAGRRHRLLKFLPIGEGWWGRSDIDYVVNYFDALRRSGGWREKIALLGRLPDVDVMHGVLTGGPPSLEIGSYITFRPGEPPVWFWIARR